MLFLGSLLFCGSHRQIVIEQKAVQNQFAINKGLAEFFPSIARRAVDPMRQAIHVVLIQGIEQLR